MPLFCHLDELVPTVVGPDLNIPPRQQPTKAFPVSVGIRIGPVLQVAFLEDLSFFPEHDLGVPDDDIHVGFLPCRYSIGHPFNSG